MSGGRARRRSASFRPSNSASATAWMTVKPCVGAVLQVPLGLLAVEPVEQLPRRVAEPEERPAVRGDEKPLVVGDLQARQRLRRRRFSDRDRERENEERATEMDQVGAHIVRDETPVEFARQTKKASPKHLASGTNCTSQYERAVREDGPHTRIASIPLAKPRCCFGRAARLDEHLVDVEDFDRSVSGKRVCVSTQSDLSRDLRRLEECAVRVETRVP